MNKILVFFLAVVVVGCAAAPINPNVERIGLTNSEPSKESREYLGAAYISQGLSLASGIKNQVIAYYEEQGKWPSSNEHIGLPPADQFRNESISGLTISEGGIITIKFTEKSGVKDGLIILTPDTGKPHMGITWVCTTPSFKDIATWIPQCKFQS